jgi:hypothetical protein
MRYAAEFYEYTALVKTPYDAVFRFRLALRDPSVLTGAGAPANRAGTPAHEVFFFPAPHEIRLRGNPIFFYGGKIRVTVHVLWRPRRISVASRTPQERIKG